MSIGNFEADHHESMAIGDVSRLTGKSPSAIRYYEQLGLLESPKRISGKRRYSPSVLRTLAVIDTAQRADFSLELKDHHGYRVIQGIYGVGAITAAIFVAETGDVSRFPTARHLCSWAGMTPKLHESDTHSYKGRITKQGSTIVRWAAMECVVRYHGGAQIAPAYRRIAERRGNNIARVAAARKLLTLVYYGLRDGEIRCLNREAA